MLLSAKKQEVEQAHVDDQCHQSNNAELRGLGEDFSNFTRKTATVVAIRPQGCG